MPVRTFIIPSWDEVKITNRNLGEADPSLPGGSEGPRASVEEVTADAGTAREPEPEGGAERLRPMMNLNR